MCATGLFEIPGSRRQAAACMPQGDELAAKILVSRRKKQVEAAPEIARV